MVCGFRCSVLYRQDVLDVRYDIYGFDRQLRTFVPITRRPLNVWQGLCSVRCLYRQRVLTARHGIRATTLSLQSLKVRFFADVAATRFNLTTCPQRMLQQYCSTLVIKILEKYRLVFFFELLIVFCVGMFFERSTRKVLHIVEWQT